MKNKIFFLLFAGALIFSCFFNFAHAQSENVSSVGEFIKSFDANITVNIDNSIDATEKIVYDSGGEDHHGIYRNIYLYSSIEYKMNIEGVSVVDENNNPYIFTTSNSSSDVNIKIGDPDKTFTGQKTYIIKYHVTKAVGQFKDFDEIYWNVTGNDWTMPIQKASVSVNLPAGVKMIQSSCYYGYKGSTDKCELKDNQNEVYYFESPRPLETSEGLTVAIGFPKGVVTSYTNSDKVSNFLGMYLSWIIGGFLPILTLILSLLYWYKNGRDPKGRGVIVPQYDVPDGLTPMEVAGIIDQKVSADNISAEIIYLATKGYIKIKQTEEKVLGLFNSTDYELTKLKDSHDGTSDFDQKLMSGLFSFGSGATVKMSDLRDVFYSHVKTITDSVLDGLLIKGYYKNLGRMKKAGNVMFVIFFMLIWGSIFFGGFIGTLFFRTNPLPIILGIFVSIIIYTIISSFFPAKTEKGVAIKEYLLGLKDYLKIAEKDRLIFHNAPEKKPEVFEKLLPYAMVLSVADIWAKEFEGIYTTPPSWYSGGSNTAFNAIVFTHSLSSFSSFASSSMSSSPSSSGSGGGGSSGGGGGGGGGGSW